MQIVNPLLVSPQLHHILKHVLLILLSDVLDDNFFGASERPRVVSETMYLVNYITVLLLAFKTQLRTYHPEFLVIASGEERTLQGLAVRNNRVNLYCGL